MRYAIALAETGRFGAAAARCNVTQPALSQQIRLLEDFCGTPAFDRLGKVVKPTPFGAEFIARAREVVARAEDLESFAVTQAGQPARPVRFGLIPTVAPYLLPSIFPALRTRLPRLDFAVSESRTDTLLAGLGAGTLDLALIATDPPGTGPRLTVEPLFTDAFVLASNEARGRTDPVQIASIARDTILLLDEGHCLRDQAIAACGLAIEPGQNSFAATSLSTIIEFVANGQGVTLLPEIALRKETTDPRIHIRPLAAPGAGRVLRLVWRRASPFSAIFTEIAVIIRATHAEGDRPDPHGG